LFLTLSQICIVTGANTGIGKAVAKILYSKNATVYAAGRSEEKTQAAVSAIKETHPSSIGRIEYLHLDLGDLTTIKASASSFLANETSLHLLFNNAGVMTPPSGTKTAQGYELQLGTNCVGPFLFTKLLTPILASTATHAPPGSVRVLWVSSSAADTISPIHGVDLGNLDYKQDKLAFTKYAVSKAGNYYHATEYARRHKAESIISVVRFPTLHTMIHWVVANSKVRR
jgi:retinol dehydrogenase 12